MILFDRFAVLYRHVALGIHSYILQTFMSCCMSCVRDVLWVQL